MLESRKVYDKITKFDTNYTAQREVRVLSRQILLMRIKMDRFTQFGVNKDGD